MDEKIIEILDIEPINDNYFEQGLPDFIGKNYAKPIDNFWKTEIEYNGFQE